MSALKKYAADHRFLLEAVARQAGLREPVAIDLDEFHDPLIKAARHAGILPIDGVLVRDWDPDNRRSGAGLNSGMRVYEIEGVRFVKLRFTFDDRRCWGID